MEDLSKLLLEERAHSEQFKTNFVQLKTEYDKLVIENHRLNDEISKTKEYKPDEPNEILKRKLKNVEKELQGKEHLIFSLKEKLETVNDVLRDKIHHEEIYTSKIAATESALEQTKMLLSNLQLETSNLVKNLDKVRKTEEQDHQRDLMTLAERCAKYDHEKRVIARQVIKATAKARSNTESLKQENGLLTMSLIKLKESIDKVCWEKSELSSQLETLKVQHGQERGEMLMQIRNLECNIANLQAKSDTLERNAQEAFREKEKAILSFQMTENDLAKLRSTHCALEMKYEKAVEQFKKDMEQKDLRHKLEIDELNKNVHSLKVELDQERSKIQHQSDKLRQHEKELITAKEELRKKEIEVSTQLQDVKIATENKYQALLEKKFEVEMETSRKSAEIESQLILERNLKASLELEMRRLTSSNQMLNERLRSLEDFEMDRKRLQNAVEVLERDKERLLEDFERHKQISAERQDVLIKEKELALSQLTIVEKETSKLVADLREHIGQLQTRLNASQKDEESQLKKLHSALKENQQKSQRYAKLIWKLRQRLANSQIHLPTAMPVSQTT